MNPYFLLLTSQLGDPQRRPLSPSQLGLLAARVGRAQRGEDDRDLTLGDLLELGYSRELGERILGILSQQGLLEAYLRRGQKLGCQPISRTEEGYPILLRRRLGLDSPGCLWAKGNLQLLSTPAVALVGSRELRGENREFARAVGKASAQQGLTLISGNARGADREAQDACLNAGGRVISIVADDLRPKEGGKNLLFLSQEDYDAPFSAQRALSRNRTIHALAQVVFVAQADLGRGGSWDGAVKNLRHGWSAVACFADGSPAAQSLFAQGAAPVTLPQLGDLTAFVPPCLWQ